MSEDELIWIAGELVAVIILAGAAAGYYWIEMKGRNDHDSEF